MRVLPWAAVAGILLAAIRNQRSVDLDVFHGMALFREALARGRLPLADPFAYTPTWPTVVHHEWGTGAVLYAFWTGLGGPAGLAVLRLLLVAGIVAASYRNARHSGATGAALAIAAPLALLMLAPGLSPVRGQMFSFLFLAVLLWLLALDRGGERRWILPWLVAAVVWANLHAGFLVGIGAVGLTAAERFASECRAEGVARALRRVSHLLLVCAGMLLLALVNPYGADYLAYLARAVTMDRPLVTEWAPLWDPRLDRVPALLHAVSLVVLAYATWKSGRARGLALAVVLAVAAILSKRHLPLYALAWFAAVVPALARTELARLVEQARTRRPAVAAALLLAVGATGTALFAGNRGWALRVPGDVSSAAAGNLVYPVDAVDALASRPFAGNLLTRFEDGAYVSWRLFPSVKVSLDSRYEAAYLPGVLEEHQAFFAAAPGWEGFLDRHRTDAVLLPCAYPVMQRLAVTPGWAAAYADRTFCVFARAPEGSQAIEAAGARR
jgi:hypothetical protein